MKLRHFLYGKSRSTVDFRTLVKSSEITDSDVKYWELKIGALMQELREFGMPGEDFMRLFIPRQHKDRERLAYEWAYVRARTGADRSSFNYQAVILGAENLDQLFWQPWALDRELFDGNTRDPRVRESLGEDGSPRPGREHNPAVIDIEFNDTSRRPQLSAGHKVAVERLVSSIANQHAPDAHWYLDEGQVGREGARRIIASLLSRLHALDRPVPGFIMGLVSVSENNSPIGSTHRSQARFTDILLASYKKEADGYFFPFENWRDATPEPQDSTVPFEEHRAVPITTATPGRYDDQSAQGDGLNAHGRAAPAAGGGSEAAGSAATPPSSSQTGRQRAVPPPQDEDEATRANRPELFVEDETQISAYPDALLGEADSLRANESYQTHSSDSYFAANTSDTGRRRQSTDPSQPSASASRPKRVTSAKGVGAAGGNFFSQVRSRLEQPLPLQLALLVTLVLLAALGTFAYTDNAKHRTEIEKKEKEVADLRAEYDAYKKEQVSKPADAVALTASMEKPVELPPAPKTNSEGDLSDLREKMEKLGKSDTSDSGTASADERLNKAQAKISELQDFIKDAKAKVDKALQDSREEKKVYQDDAKSVRSQLQLAQTNIADLNVQINGLKQRLDQSEAKANGLETQLANAQKNPPERGDREEAKLSNDLAAARRDPAAAQQDLERERERNRQLGELRNARPTNQINQDRGCSAEAELNRVRGRLSAFCKRHDQACEKLQEFLPEVK